MYKYFSILFFLIINQIVFAKGISENPEAIKRLASALSRDSTENIKFLSLEPKVTHITALRKYGSLVYESPQHIIINDETSKTINHQDLFLVNAPYLISIISADILKFESKEHITYLSHKKHMTLAARNKLFDKTIKLIEQLEKIGYKFAFDGGAETECGSPTHRLILFNQIERDRLYFFDFEYC